MKPPLRAVQAVKAWAVVDENYDWAFIYNPNSVTDGMYPIYVSKEKAVEGSLGMNKHIVAVKVIPIIHKRRRKP